MFAWLLTLLVNKQYRLFTLAIGIDTSDVDTLHIHYFDYSHFFQVQNLLFSRFPESSLFVHDQPSLVLQTYSYCYLNIFLILLLLISIDYSYLVTYLFIVICLSIILYLHLTDIITAFYLLFNFINKVVFLLNIVLLRYRLA